MHFYTDQPFAIIALYVDDALMLTKTEEDGLIFVGKIKKKFHISIMNTGKFVGIQYFESGDYIYLHQKD